MTTIVIIEDDDGITAVLSDFLAAAGYEVVCFRQGEEALAFIAEAHTDLVVLDLMLPSMQGPEVLEELRRRNAVPVIVLTAKEELESKVELLRQGADDYITKPFEQEEVLARIEAALRRYRNVSDQKILYDDITIERVTHTVTVGGRSVSLTHTEYALLEILCCYPTKVFSKKNLYESVWDDPYAYQDDKLGVHISNLRKKLKCATGKDYVDTVWGIGYKIK